MGLQVVSPVLLLIAVMLLLQGCASTQMGEQRFAQANIQMQNPADPQACPSKWVAAGNNGAKADRYFQVSC